MSTLNLGKIRFNWTGAYNNSTAYVANDVVSSGGNSYICKLASTGNAVSNGTYWDLMSQAGTNGTTVGLGTAGQVLQTNAGASATEWADASGGAWNLIATTTASTSASIAFESNIDSTYQNYAVIGSAIVTVSDGNNMYVALGTGGTPTYATSYDYKTSLPASNNHDYAGLGFNANSQPVLLGGIGNVSGEGAGFTLYMYNPSGTTTGTFIASTGTCHNEHSYAVINSMAMVYPATTAVTAIKFTLATGNISSGVFKLYGIS